MKNSKGYKMKNGDKKVAQMTPDDIEHRKVLFEILNKPGYDKETKMEAQRMWIQMQKRIDGPSKFKGV